MKRIGIVTITDKNNYGNRLQNIAMGKILSRYGSVFNILRYYSCEELHPLKHMIKTQKNIIKLILKQLIRKEYHYYRYLSFKKDEKYNSKPYIIKFMKHTNYKRLNNEFDCFVCGSDQVWNPILYPDMYINMLGFADNNKKIAIAPSIATDELTQAQEDMFKTYLKDFNVLSCREQQGANLIEKLTGKQVVSLVDPTLMLSQKDWDNMVSKPKFHDEYKSYIFLYFLGNMSDEYLKLIQSIGEKYNLEIINILDKKSKYYSCGPSEFIYLIKNSTLVITDSFHGSVFSYIYNKPFRILYRLGGCGYMNSRLINLMDKLHLDESVYLKEDASIDNILEVNYDKTYLEKEQKKFNDYLDNIFLK